MSSPGTINQWSRRDYLPASIRALHVAAQVASSHPPREDIAYRIDCSLDGGETWTALLKDGRIHRRGVEPADFWSQSMWSAARAAGKHH
jgi:hypothetical protein